MKIRRLLHTITFLSTVVFITSCGASDPLIPHDPDDGGKFTYEIDGLKDTSLERIDEIRYLITVEKLTGKSEPVLLSGEDLPKGMEVFYEPFNNVQPSYNTVLVIKSVRVKEGTHTIRIKGASPTNGISYWPINVFVKPYSNAAEGLVGYFKETGECVPSGAVNDNVRIVAHETVKNRIILKGLFSGVMTNEVYADINPANNTLTIPEQEQNFVDFKGEGTFDDDKIIVNYTVSGVNFTESCSTTIIRQ